MNVKKLVKVANYYDVKYGFKKEAVIGVNLPVEEGPFTEMVSYPFDSGKNERQSAPLRRFTDDPELDKRTHPVKKLFFGDSDEGENLPEEHNRLQGREKPPLGWAESMSKADKESQDDWGKPRISPYDLKKETDSEILTYLASMSNFLASPPDMSDIYSVAPNITSSRAQQLLSKLTSMWTDRKNKTLKSDQVIGTGNAPKKPAASPVGSVNNLFSRINALKQRAQQNLSMSPDSSSYQSLKRSADILAANAWKAFKDEGDKFNSSPFFARLKQLEPQINWYKSDDKKETVTHLDSGAKQVKGKTDDQGRWIPDDL